MGEPEHIGKILQRVFDDLEKKYREKLGGFLLDRERDASTIPARLPVEGENDAQPT